MLVKTSGIGSCREQFDRQSTKHQIEPSRKAVCSRIKGATPKNVVHVNIQFLGPISKMNELCSFPRQTVSISVYAPTTNAKEAEVERLYEALQDLLEFTLKKDVIFIIGDWNAKEGGQEIPGVTDKFGLGVQNEAGQRLTEFCQENTLAIANTLFQQHKR